jgi:hypothetical protein
LGVPSGAKKYPNKATKVATAIMPKPIRAPVFFFRRFQVWLEKENDWSDMFYCIDNII